jgi:hypothetical protein
LHVRLTPRASRNAIEGVMADAAGAGLLRVSVTAVPENGKANAALIELLAKQLRIAKRSIAITAGAAERRKVLFIAGDADLLRHRLALCTRKP